MYFSRLIAIVLFLAGTSCFAQSLPEIQASIKAKGQKWVAAETSISVLSDQEKGRRLGLIKRHLREDEDLLAVEPPVTGLPSTFTYQSSWASDVRNQGSCGSCWAFATAAALESNIMIRNNTPGFDIDLAEQVILSCSGAGGCNGGYIDGASDFLRSTGAPPEADFPYTATNNSCGAALAGWQTRAQRIGSWSWVTGASPNLDVIKNALYNYGPLVTTMDVYSDFFSYTDGVYEYANGSIAGGHAVLIVGYEDNNGFNGGGFFIVKNSWGGGWGESGYFRIAYSQLASEVNFGAFTIAYSSPVTSPPAAPMNLSATLAASTRIDLAWMSGSTNHDGFKIWRCVGAGCSAFSQIAIVGSASTAYADLGLASGTTYKYKVLAYNSAGDSPYSNESSATTPAACSYAAKQLAQLPFPPAGGTGTVSVTTQPGCSWTAKSGSPWISVKGASGTGSGSFNYKVSQNRGAARTGTITAAGQSVTVTQSGK